MVDPRLEEVKIKTGVVAELRNDKKKKTKEITHIFILLPTFYLCH